MNNYSVLVVDDEENVYKLLKKVISKKGFTVYTASNALQALSIIDTTQIDIVISDIKMPGKSGIELLHEIKKIDSDIKVIMITAFATLETAIKAMRDGASDYITKPFDLEEIISSLNRIIKMNQKNDNDLKETILLENEKPLIAESPAMKNVMDIIKRVAYTDAPVMLYGETGTGKSVAAEVLHNFSLRKDKPFIKVNCAAIPEALLESELFGYEKGSFADAAASKPGRLELADKGTIFLNEIADIPSPIQVKLLHVIQDKEFERLGGISKIKIDVRIIAATNKDLESMVNENKFRKDLFYKLNIVPITMPPLRERKEAIPFFVKEFLTMSSAISHRAPKELTKDALSRLIDYKWPGNIGELQNIIERSVVISKGDIITTDDFPKYIIEDKTSEESGEQKLENAVDNAERDIIIKALKECNGNRTKASEVLGISRRSLHRKIAKYSIKE